MAEYFVSMTCQAGGLGVTRSIKFYVRRSDTLDITADDEEFIRQWAAKRIHSPLQIAVQQLAEIIAKNHNTSGTDEILRKKVIEIMNSYKQDRLPGMKEFPTHLPRFLEGGKQISYEIFESTY